MTVGNLKGTLKDNPNGAILFTKIGSEDAMEEYVKNKFNGRINLRFWYVNQVVVSEFYSPKTSKANALKIVCDYYNIPHEKTIAIGDGHNDIEMIECNNSSEFPIVIPFVSHISMNKLFK